MNDEDMNVVVDDTEEINIMIDDDDEEEVVISENDILKGKDGEDGYTPVRGTDYWTEEDVNAMYSHINTKIQNELGTLNDELEARLVGGE